MAIQSSEKQAFCSRSSQSIAPTSPVFERQAIQHLTAEALLSLSKSRRLALNQAEMQAIQQYYQSQNREPKDIELEMISQTWSEHCSHKSFNALIHYGEQNLDGLLDSYLRAATKIIKPSWVAAALVGNASIIKLCFNATSSGSEDRF